MRITGNIAVLMCAILLTSACAFGQARTTPVDVKNPVSIDSTNNIVKALIDPLGNTVKAIQSGTWSVNVNGTPTVAVTNTPSITVSGTPNVAVTNSPTVKISAVDNNVKIPVQSVSNPLWGSERVVAGNGVAGSVHDCTGFREARICVGLKDMNGADLNKVRVSVLFKGPTGAFMSFGQTTLVGNTPIGDTGVLNKPGWCTLRIPIMGDEMTVNVNNDNATSVTLWEHCYIYLVK